LLNGTRLKVFVLIGSEFSQGDVLLEIETDKAQIDVEAPDDGFLIKIIVFRISRKVTTLTMSKLVKLLLILGKMNRMLNISKSPKILTNHQR
jgi:pyruvate carboxylase